MKNDSESKKDRVSVTNEQVFNFYKDKATVNCPLTEELVKAGFRQDLKTDENGEEDKSWSSYEKGGYIDNYIKKHNGKRPNYREAIPSQHWHLITSYQEMHHADPNQPFLRVKCEELYFWMIEASEVEDAKKELTELKDKILGDEELRPKDLRSRKPEDFKAWKEKYREEIKNLFKEKVIPVIVKPPQDEK